jgi:hypothetical protein
LRSRYGFEVKGRIGVRGTGAYFDYVSHEIIGTKRIMGLVFSGLFVFVEAGSAAARIIQTWSTAVAFSHCDTANPFGH